MSESKYHIWTYIRVCMSESIYHIWTYIYILYIIYMYACVYVCPVHKDRKTG